MPNRNRSAKFLGHVFIFLTSHLTVQLTRCAHKEGEALIKGHKRLCVQLQLANNLT